MAIDDVEDVTPRVQYTASSSQTNFDYVFPIFEDADLVVDDNGTTMALSTDYTVSGAGNDTGGTVTFLVGRTSGHTITIYRDIPIERITQFAVDGPQSADSYNEELNRITMVQQQLDERIKRCLREPIIGTVADADLELDMSAFAGKYLTFDADGVPTPADATTVSTDTTIPGLGLDGSNNLQYTVSSVLRWAANADGSGYLQGILTCGGVNVTGSAIPSAGIYRPTTNTLGFSTNGVARGSIDASGRWSLTAASVGNAISLTDGTRTAVLKTVTGGYQLLATSAHSLALGANNAVGLTFSATGEMVFAGGVATTPVAIGNSGTTFTVNCRLSNVFTVTMTGNVASGGMVLSNPSDGQTINIKLTQDGTGSRTMAFQAAILFPGGVDGVLSTAAGAVDYLVMTYHADTTSWHATLTQAFA